MKVLMIGVDESTKGGMWTVVENYLNDKKFVKKNNLIYIPTSITGCSIIKKIFFTFKSYIKILKEYQKNDFDILHVHMSERGSIKRKGLVMKYAKKKGTKIVLHMHGAEFEVLYKQMNKTKQKKVRNILKLADKIIILGIYWNDFVSSLVDNKDKIVVVYNAIKVPKNYEYNLKSNSILFLGAICKRKGKDIILKTLKNKSEVLKNKCTVEFYGPDVDGDIVELINKNNLDSWVKYKGWLNKENKSEVLKNTMINILPSYNEGLPMTILEAMSYGIPSITTNVAAIPEAVNEKNGVIIEPGSVEELGNALENMVINEDYRKKLSERAYKDAINIFSIEKHISQIQDIYEELNN